MVDCSPSRLHPLFHARMTILSASSKHALDLQESSEVSNGWARMMERSDSKSFSYPSQRLAREAPCRSALGSISSFHSNSSSEGNVGSTLTDTFARPSAECRTSLNDTTSSIINESVQLHSQGFCSVEEAETRLALELSTTHSQNGWSNTTDLAPHSNLVKRSSQDGSSFLLNKPREGFLDVFSEGDNRPSSNLDLSLSRSEQVGGVRDHCNGYTAHLSARSIQPKQRKAIESIEEINFMGIKKRRVEKAGEEQEQGLAGEICLSSSVQLPAGSPEDSVGEVFSSSRSCSTSTSTEEEYRDGKEADQGLQLVSLLLKCAALVSNNYSRHSAELILESIFEKARPDGDAMQRLSLYFAESLAARLALKGSPLCKAMASQPSHEQLFAAFAALHKVSPCFQFAHFTSNQAIIEAFEGQQQVHIIDIDMSKGFQWASLLQSLASRHGGPPRLVRLTGIGRKEGMLWSTAQRLSSFAKTLNIGFEFEGIAEDRLENLSPGSFNIRAGEAIAVNCVFELHRLLNDEAGGRVMRFLSTIRSLKPHVVTVVEQEASHNALSFMGRFVEALHYYAAIFDSLDASFPRQSQDRLKIEQLFFARQIRNIVTCEGGERVERHERSDSWRQRMENAGFEAMDFSEHSITQAKLLLQYFPCDGYRLVEGDGMLSLGWQERPLITASAWRPFTRHNNVSISTDFLL